MSGLNQAYQFYRPYDSEDESGADSETASTDSWSSRGEGQSPAPVGSTDGIPNFQSFATQMQLLDAAGRNFSTVRDAVDYGVDKLGKYTVYGHYDAPIPDISGESEYGLTRFATQNGNDTSLVVLDSRYRDRTAYPQPTLCTLRLPRTYKSLTSIQFSEMKLLTSFYFFRLTKGNTDISINEKDRSTFTYSNTWIPCIPRYFINDGSYNIDSLQTAITNQLNSTPLFYDFINGFNDFIPIFKASGNFAINFNQPGDTYYDYTTKQFIPNPTIYSITTNYWQTQFAGLTYYTTAQLQLAYYYPVLNQAIQDPTSSVTINLQAGIGINPAVTTTDEVIDQILYLFTGLIPVDQVVLAVIVANIPALDQYRLENTFRYFLINKYIVSRNQENQRVFFTSPSLNTSLVNLLNMKSAQYLTQALQIYNLTAKQYASLTTSVQQALAVTIDMYNYEQEQFYTYFAVPWSQYQLNFYAILSNTFLLRNGFNSYGIPSNDVQAINAGIISYSNQSQYLTPPSPTYWWPHLSNYHNSTIFMTNLSTATSSFVNVYDMSQSNILPDRILIDPANSNYIYIDELTVSGNAVCPINAGQYTVFKFASPVRQTLQVETLFRPLAYRLPLYNQSNFGSSINQYFDMSYNFVSSIHYPVRQPTIYTEAYDNLPRSNLNQVPGWAFSNASQSSSSNYSWLRNLSTSKAFCTSNFSLDITSYNRTSYFQFTTPFVSSASLTSSYTYNINLSLDFFTSTLSQTLNPIPTPIQLFLYHDRGAFEGDVLFSRNENPRFYKFSTLINTGETGTKLSFTTYQNQTYYCSIRPDSNNFGTTYFQLLPYLSTNNLNLQTQSLSVQGLNPATDPFLSNFSNLVQKNLNYAQVYDSNLIRLPIASNLAQPDPTVDPNNQYIPILEVPIGYDNNDVSTDYTDYIPFGYNDADGSFVPTSNLSFDPLNEYEFQSNSPYNTDTQTFLYYGGSNSIFLPNLTNTYIPGIVSARETKLVNYYSPTYIPIPEVSGGTPSNLITNLSTTQQPYTNLTTNGSNIGGYDYAGTSCNLQLGRGVLGFSIIPSQGVWDLKRIMLRSAIYNSNDDPNANIAHLGVYILGDILGTQTVNLSLANAIFKLDIDSRSSYTSTITLDSPGFDIKGGTYYEFIKDENFVASVSSFLLGYFQNAQTMVTQPESVYTVIAFTSNLAPTTFKALSGSAIPYPFYNMPFVSSAYLDGSKPYPSTNQLIFPSTIGQTIFPSVTSLSTVFAPPPGVDDTQAQYSLSDPIGTSVMTYKKYVPLSNDSLFFEPWTMTASPSQLIGTVPEYMMVQDTNYIVYKYTSNSFYRNFSNAEWNLTADQIFPSYEFTSLVGASGNSSSYFFIGLSNYNNVSNVLRIKQFSPYTGSLNNYLLDSSFIVPIGGTVNGFLMNDYEQMALSYTLSNSTAVNIYVNLNPSTSMTSFQRPGPIVTMSIDPITSTLYYIPASSNTSISRTYLTAGFPTTTAYAPSSTSTPYWTELSVINSNAFNEPFDRLYLTSAYTSTTSIFYNTTSFDSGTMTMVQIPSSNTGDILTLATGTGGSVWFTDSVSPAVWGNRNTEADFSGPIIPAWQIFYPFQKVTLVKVANEYSPITDLTYVNYPEYPHTCMFYYSNVTSFYKDAGSNWGLESSSNYVTADTNLTGYGFNSYIFNAPLRKSANSNDLQVLAVRAYSPTENSETLIRFNLPNKYNYGYINSLQLIEEISSLKNNSLQFNQNYAYTLSTFDLVFNLSNYWGANLVPNFNGSNYNSSNFAGFASNLSTVYQSYQSNASLLSSIEGYVNSNILVFISTQMKYILPPSALGRENYTDPLTFSIKWQSSLLPQYAALLDDWGLGYNLGFAKLDTPYSTYTEAESFYKILEDYIYLRLNPEYQMNKIDTTAKEDFNITRDSTGQINNYHGKLLLSDFNTYSRSFVSNQITFNPPIGKLDLMYFQWLDNGGTQINNVDCEWSATMNVTENKPIATVASTLPALPPMNFVRK